MRVADKGRLPKKAVYLYYPNRQISIMYKSFFLYLQIVQKQVSATFCLLRSASYALLYSPYVYRIRNVFPVFLIFFILKNVNIGILSGNIDREIRILWNVKILNYSGGGIIVFHVKQKPYRWPFQSSCGFIRYFVPDSGIQRGIISFRLPDLSEFFWSWLINLTSNPWDNEH